EVLAPAVEERPPAGAGVVRGPQEVELLALHFEQLAEQRHRRGLVRRRGCCTGRTAGDVLLEKHERLSRRSGDGHASALPLRPAGAPSAFRYTRPRGATEVGGSVR